MELIVASLIIVFICCGCIIYYKLELRFHVFQGI